MDLTRNCLAVIFLASVALAVSAQAMAKPLHHKTSRAAATTTAPAWGQADIDSRYPTLDKGLAAQTTPEARPVRHSRKSAAQSAANDQATSAVFASGDIVSEARRYMGGNPTGRGSLWCGAFMDMVLKHTGHKGGGNLARGYASYGTRVSGPQVGAIAVMGRRGGGHVGVVSGIDSAGNPIIISGNHNNKVDESVYPRGRIIAYVIP